MVKTNKPKSIMVTLRDRKENKSISFTVYDTDIEELKEKILEILKN